MQNGHADVYAMLLRKNPNLKKSKRGQRCNITISSYTSRSCDVCTVLLKNNVNINEKLETGATSLVVHEDHANISTVLLENNANTSENMKNNATTLFQAAHQGHADICLVLLENNPNIKEV